MFGGCGNMMEFNNSAEIQMHYTDVQIGGNNIDESTITVKYWDESSSDWKEVDELVIVDGITNTVTFSQSNVSPYFILTGDEVTSVQNR
ncbi:MAG: hypothetical protein U5K00_04180 [Melioribacteraceae bacterium]|nr:hypothetical protein [Melioribacteraceae bacterium]